MYEKSLGTGSGGRGKRFGTGSGGVEKKKGMFTNFI